jgi:hypothetical protein
MPLAWLRRPAAWSVEGGELVIAAGAKTDRSSRRQLSELLKPGCDRRSPIRIVLERQPRLEPANSKARAPTTLRRPGPGVS